MKMELSIFFSLCALVVVSAQSRYGGFHGDERLAHICYKRGESPLRDFMGRKRLCAWSIPPCPYGSQCRFGLRGAVCCRSHHGPGHQHCRDGSRSYGPCHNDRHCRSYSLRCEFNFGFIGKCCHRYHYPYNRN